MDAARPTEYQDLQRRIEELGPRFQNLNIDGHMTAPDHFLGDYPAFKWNGFQHVRPTDLGGRQRNSGAEICVTLCRSPQGARVVSASGGCGTILIPQRGCYEEIA